MNTTENKQCPNCWGFQEYDEINPENIICDCATESKTIKK